MMSFAEKINPPTHGNSLRPESSPESNLALIGRQPNSLIFPRYRRFAWMPLDVTSERSPPATWKIIRLIIGGKINPPLPRVFVKVERIHGIQSSVRRKTTEPLNLPLLSSIRVDAPQDDEEEILRTRIEGSLAGRGGSGRHAQIKMVSRYERRVYPR